ncbi:AAA family ATPase [Ottowia sp. GY511]|uniref:AAA family ATPase n=1 Tax=Ottowia flava TaxID=2675430 RepID=A0ABW4KYK8_9BURK|nr:AAA family ATPase [Ottowia sp. GY511]TXK31228.1 AAA family ATPase [Ottowia sp. GY511]
MLSALAVANYRSLRRLTVPLGALTVVTGPNGSGKSSLYRALRLLADVAQGGVVRSLAREGGLPSTLWAGPEQISAAMRRAEVPVQGTVRRERIRLKLGFASADPQGFGYAIEIGLPTASSSAFALDPEIKAEAVFHGPVARVGAQLVRRTGAVVQVRANGRSWDALERAVPAWASMVTELSDPQRTPELLEVREQVRAWRFYDHFRTDADSPVRQPQLGTRTPVLAADGSDLAAAVQTILEIGDAAALQAAVEDAFPGARLAVQGDAGARLALHMHQPGLLRALSVAELSDGTLRYLLWIAALLSPRPPPLLVLNEPEASLHPDLLPALGRLIAGVAERAQVIVVTHSTRLVAALEAAAEPGALVRIELEKNLGETLVRGLAMDEIPPWSWPGD